MVGVWSILSSNGLHTSIFVWALRCVDNCTQGNIFLVEQLLCWYSEWFFFFYLSIYLLFCSVQGHGGVLVSIPATLGSRQGTPWIFHQSIAEPHADKQPLKLRPRSPFRVTDRVCNTIWTTGRKTLFIICVYLVKNKPSAVIWSFFFFLPNCDSFLKPVLTCFFKYYNDTL